MGHPTLNPIISGFAPDPSVCLIDDTFFLVNSSFHVFPGLPIYASKDLNSWTHIGNAISRPSQLSLSRATTILHTGEASDNGTTVIATGGLYAPTIRHHKGSTYIVCTNVIHGTGETPNEEANFIIHTTDIYAGTWSDPVYYDCTGIDPSILFDDDGKVYTQGTRADPDTRECQIYNVEIDLQSGKMSTEPRVIWAGWDKRYTEAPHIYKRDGWYYLLCAEGGTFTTHMVCMARSEGIWGPYEACPRNPIWTAHGTSNYVQHTGHADLFQDGQGGWWAVMLGVRMSDGRFNMGRESFLTRVEWPEGQWPTVQPVMADLEEVRRSSERIRCTDDELEWVYLRDPELDRYELHDADVRLKASVVELTSPDKSVTFIGKRQRALTGTAVVTLCTNGLEGQSIRAGLVMYKDELRFLAVGYDFQEKRAFCHGISKPRDFVLDMKRELMADQDLMFQVSYTEQAYQLSFKLVSDEGWTLLGEIDTLETGGFDFTGPLIGMFAVGPDVDVHLKNFSIDD